MSLLCIAVGDLLTQSFNTVVCCMGQGYNKHFKAKQEYESEEKLEKNVGACKMKDESE